MPERERNGGRARRREILREVGSVLEGRVVGLWEVSQDGHVSLLDTGVPSVLGAEAAVELEAALSKWAGALTAGRRWVGCKLDRWGRWCVAPVRTETAGPPPYGVERRGRERMALELAGLCLGLAEQTHTQGTEA